MNIQQIKNEFPKITAILILVVNLCFFHFLPNKVGLHLDESGEIGYVPKIIFVVLLPVISIAIHFIYRFIKKVPKNILMFVSVFLLVLDLVIIMMNILA